MSFSTFTPFQSDVETIKEFLERFKAQNSAILSREATTAAQKAALLCRSLPVSVITDIQRRIKPTVLSEATYEIIETQLLAQFDVKQSVIGAAVKLINRKQQQSESIET